jgi:hypothetical protein
MASGVNVKMGVSGLSQFKNNMNQAKQATKTLDAQLALTEKQFKASGDAESYMAEKSELLKAKLEQQKKVVSNAEQALDEMRKKGIDTSSKSYQDLYRQMIQAKGAMIDTENELNGIADSGEDAAANVENMNDQLGAVGKGISYQNVTDALGKITDGMEAVMKKALEVGKAITKEVLGAGSWADDLNTRAAYFGLEPEELQRMEKTAALIDTSVESIVKARKKLMTNVGKGNKATDEALDALGIEYLGDAEDTFWKAGEAIMKLSDEAEQEAKANALFGKSWSELIPLFTAGREEYEKLNASWSVVDKEQVQALQDLDDEYQKLSIEFDTVKKKFDASIAQGLTPVMETLTGLMKEFNKYLESPQGKEMLESLGRAVGSLFEDLANVDPEGIVQSITGVIEDIKGALDWIKTNKSLVVGAVEAFIGAWAALKTAEGVTIALQLITGIKNLAGMGGTGGTLGALGSKLAAAGATTAVSGGISQVAQFASYNGGSVWDWLTHESPLGPVFQGFESLGEWWERMKAEQHERAQNFGSNWDANSENANIIAKNGGNTIRFWDDFWSRAFTGDTGWNWGPSGEGTGDDWTDEEAQDLSAAIARMTDQIEGDRSDTKKSTDDMTDAAGDMSKAAKNLPQNVRDALMGLKIVLDEQTVGQIIDSYLASKMD